MSPGPQLGLLAVYVRGEGRLAPRLCVQSACIYICLALEPWSREPGAWSCVLVHPGPLPEDCSRTYGPTRRSMNGSQSHTAVCARLRHSPLFFFSNNVESARPSTVTANNAADRLSAGRRKESAAVLKVKVPWKIAKINSPHSNAHLWMNSIRKCEP